MRILKSILAVLLIALCAQTASAQFKIGPRVGLNVSELHFNRDVFDADNRAGFTGGVMIEFTAPVIGLGFDLSAMYSRRNTQWMEKNELTSDNRDYFTIPVNLKWKLKLPVVKPFLTTGPEFSFLTSRKAISEAYHNRKVDTSWNVGFGVELLNHLQVSANYGIGLNKALKTIGVTSDYEDISAKNRVWTITAAYLF